MRASKFLALVRPGPILAAGVVMGLMILSVTGQEQAPPEEAPPQAAPAEETPEEPKSQAEEAPVERGPMLGVIVSRTPGAGVLVHAVAARGPAAMADIRRGDFLLKLGDQEIESPQHLREMLSEHKPGDEVELTVWRAGEEQTVRVKLFQPRRGDRFGFRRPRTGARRGLGMMLQSTGEDGLRVEHVRPEGPAERAGVRAGDVVVRIGERAVTTVRDVFEALRAADGDQHVQVTVRRNGEEMAFDVQVTGSGRRPAPRAAEDAPQRVPAPRGEDAEETAVPTEEATEPAEEAETRIDALRQRLERLVRQQHELQSALRELESELNSVRQARQPRFEREPERRQSPRR